MTSLSLFRPWRVVVSAAASTLFLLATVLYPVWRGRLDDGPAVVIQTAALALFCSSFAVTIGGLWAVRETSGRSLLPLIPQAIALGIMLLPPVTRQVDLAEFQQMVSWRSAVVEQVANGELAIPTPTPEPTVEVVFLPSNFPRAVSDAAGQHAVAVVRRKTGFDVVFLPPKGIRARATGYVYRSDDTYPDLPNGSLPQFDNSERIAPHWYRLTS